MNNIDSSSKEISKNTIYIDCFAGCSGDMLLGAFFDMGLPFDDWKNEILKLGISGFDLEISERMDYSIKGTKFNVRLNDKDDSHRGIKEISNIISKSTLSEAIKEDSLNIFKVLAEAEATIHNTTPDKIHFHEVGATDSIIDIVGFCIAKDMMKIDKIISSPFHLGTGIINTAHGIMPVPSPATLEIIRGKPVVSRGINSELTTPTGASILTALASEFGTLPGFTIHAIGYGYGSRKLTIPNFVRILYGNRGNL